MKKISLLFPAIFVSLILEGTASMLPSSIFSGIKVFKHAVLAQTPSIQNQLDTDYILGELTHQSNRLIDGSYYSVYKFDGQEGEKITIDAISTDFKPSLTLLDHNGVQLDFVFPQDSDSVTAAATLRYELSSNGTHTVLVSGSTERGDADSLSEYVGDPAGFFEHYITGVTGGYQISLQRESSAGTVRVANEGLTSSDKDIISNQQSPLSQVRALEAELGNYGIDLLDPNVDLSYLTYAAFTYSTAGDYERAENVLSIQIENTQNIPEKIYLLGSLAAIYRLKQDYHEARDILEEVQFLVEGTPLLETYIQTIPGGLQLGVEIYTATGEYEKAAELLKALRRQYSESTGSLYYPYRLEAELARRLGNYVESENLLLQELQISEDVSNPFSPNFNYSANSGLLNLLAENYWLQGNTDQAVRYRNLSLEAEERLIQNSLARASDIQAQQLLNSLENLNHATITFSVSDIAKNRPHTAKLGLDSVLQYKGRILDLLSDRNKKIRQQLIPANQNTFDRLTEVRSQIAELSYVEAPTQDVRAQVNELEKRAQQLETELAQSSSVFRSVNQPVNSETISTQLPEDAAFIEFVQYSPYELHQPLADGYGPSRYAAYVLKENGDVVSIDLGPSAEIDALVSAARRALQSNPNTVGAEEVKSVVQRLSKTVLEPIKPHISEVEHLLIAPDASLNLVPFEALVHESDRYLVQDYQVSYVTSGRDLLSIKADTEAAEPPVLIADPVFGKPGVVAEIGAYDTRFGQLSERKFPPLENTAAEAEAIADYLNVPEQRLLTRERATEHAVKNVYRPSILHIATHGFFSDVPRDSSVNLSSTNFLLNSGLVFAGVETGESGSGEDGVLSSLEAAELDLLGTQLVVLSACETGLGNISAGEGLFGLRRALTLAGSESQLVSLWQVLDSSTKDLMIDYYDHLSQGEGRSEALRSAQLKMLADRNTAHPYYWAPFTMSGNWAPL